MSKKYSSVLPGATRIECKDRQRDFVTEQSLKSKLAEVFNNGFWFCDGCESRCERVEGENGRPAHCDACGAPLTERNWNAPLWTRVIPDEKVLEPHHLKPLEAA